MTVRLPAAPYKSHHVLAAAGLFLLALVVLLWTTRGLSYPNPADVRAPAAMLQQKAASDREVAITRFSVTCLDALTRGELDLAIKNCNLAIELDPSNVTLLDLRGNALVLAGNPGKALADFSRAIVLSPADPNSYRYRGNVYFMLKRDALALADYNRAVLLDPQNALGIELRGHFFQARGEYTSAIADFTRSIALKPDEARTWNSRCWTRVLANRELGTALADCDHALALDPRYANAYDSRGYVHVRMGKFADAIADFDHALAITPELATSLFGRGLAKLRTGDATARLDLAQARLLDHGIEMRFAAIGFRLKANGISGT